MEALLADLQHDLQRFPPRPIQSIFIGGGTPSLLSAQFYERLFAGIKAHLPFEDSIEITLEANPGTCEQARFSAYRQLGINRLSLGIQSFHDHHLKYLGRIHDSQQALRAIECARQANFDNINLDLMHGLPKQTVTEGLDDLKQGIALQPEHLSWYQLTIEANTVFYKTQPVLPSEEACDALEQAGLALLRTHNYRRYEISAFCQADHEAKHNLNYWRFGDYYGIGAGAHSKLTALNGAVFRMQKPRQPHAYLKHGGAGSVQSRWLSGADLLFEFMLNATRLQAKIPLALFQQTTGLAPTVLLPYLEQAAAKGFVTMHQGGWHVTRLGRRFTNDLQALFLPEADGSGVAR